MAPTRAYASFCRRVKNQPSLPILVIDTIQWKINRQELEAEVIGATGVKFDIFFRRETHNWNPKRLTNSGIKFDGRSRFPPASSLQCVPSAINDDPPGNGSQSSGDVSSADGGIVAQTQAVSDETSEPRQDRVARLRQQVRSGTYEIPVSQLVRILADIILRRR